MTIDSSTPRASGGSGVAHVVNFLWRADVSEQDVATLQAELTALQPQLNGLLYYAFGPDLGLREGNSDFAVVGVFADLASYHAYAEHPEHVRVIRDVVGPMLAERHAVQIQLRHPFV